MFSCQLKSNRSHKTVWSRAYRLVVVGYGDGVCGVRDVVSFHSNPTPSRFVPAAPQTIEPKVDVDIQFSQQSIGSTEHLD